MSFRDTNPEIRIGTLHCNNIKNVKAKYKILFNININETIQLNNKNTKDCTLDAKKNSKSIFLAAEQGSSKHVNDIQVMPDPKMKCKVREWITKVCDKLEIKNHHEKLSTSFIPIREVEENTLQY